MTTTYDVQRVYRVIGARRSGNHALIHWMLSNITAPEVVFLNEARPGSAPHETCSEVEWNGTHYGLEQRHQLAFKAAAKAACQAHTVIISYEDHDASNALNKKGFTPGVPPENMTTVIIYRDFLNWLASYHALQTRNIGHRDWTVIRGARILSAVYAWARNIAVVNDTQIAARRDYVGVSYDDWMGSDDYRRALAQRLKLEGDDPRIPAPSAYGGGSSFQVGAAASELQWHNRWQGVADEPCFRRIVNDVMADRSVADLIAAHFPNTYAIIVNEF